MALERLREVRLDFEASDGAREQVGREQFVALLAQRLRAVHGDIGVAQHVFGPILAVATRRDADAGAGEHLASLDGKGRVEGT